MTETVADALRARLRAALRDAMRAKDPATVAALRSLIAAVDNAEAVDPDVVLAGEESSVIAGAVVGLGSGDVPRKVLTHDEVADLVRGEIAERHEQAAMYDGAGHPDRATRLRSEAEALEPFTA